jgi:hypothetical protein
MLRIETVAQESEMGISGLIRSAQNGTLFLQVFPNAAGCNLTRLNSLVKADDVWIDVSQDCLRASTIQSDNASA